jgi:hypothetical protein
MQQESGDAACLLCMLVAFYFRETKSFTTRQHNFHKRATAAAAGEKKRGGVLDTTNPPNAESSHHVRSMKEKQGASLSRLLNGNLPIPVTRSVTEQSNSCSPPQHFWPE